MLEVQSEIKAKDVMTPDPVSVSPGATIRELARVFEENDISGAPVVDQGGTLVGVVTQTDLIRRCAEGTVDLPPAFLFEVLSEQGDEDDSEIIPEPLVCVEDFMTEEPVTVAPGTPVEQVARIMFEKRIHRVIVVDPEKYPVGIITCLDLVGVFRAKPQGETS